MATSQEVHHEMLDITEPHLYDESLSSMDYYEYTPQTIQSVCKLV